MRAALPVLCLLALSITVGCGAREAPRIVNVNQNEAERKIIYTGQLQMVVPDLSRFETQLSEQLQVAGGFIAEHTQDRTIEHYQHAQWTVRIPAKHFDAATKAIAELGLATRRELTSEDVTDATLDLEARLKNQRTLEQRLLEIIEKKAGDLKDLLAVEEQLSRVRQEIERLEARQRLMQDRVALSTLVIIVSEQPEYLPAATASFSDRVRIAFNQSLQNVLQGAEGLLIVMIYLLPWLAIFALMMSSLYWFVRRRIAIAKVTSAAQAG